MTIQNDLAKLVLNEPLCKLGLPERIISTLETQRGVILVKDLLNLTPQQLRATKHVGDLGFTLIMTALAAHGFPVAHVKVDIVKLVENHQRLSGAAYRPIFNQPHLVPYAPIHRTQSSSHLE